MRITSPIALAIGLIMFVAVAAGAQTPPPAPAPTPTPTEQTPPPTPPPSEPVPPQAPPVTTPPEQTPATVPAPAIQPSPDTQPAARPRFFLSANGGYQFISQTFESSAQFDAFEEPATLSSSGELKSEPIFDAGVAYRLSHDFGAGAAFSLYVTENNVAVLARVPHPIFFDQVRVANYEAAGVKHTSGALHLNGIWFVPFTTKVDFQISAGPSIVFVRQDVVTAANLLSEDPPFTEPRIDTITLTARKKTVFGFNAGVDTTYAITPRVGVGFMARYVFASADIEGLTDSLKVGGFQALGGVRFRF